MFYTPSGKPIYKGESIYRRNIWVWTNTPVKRERFLLGRNTKIFWARIAKEGISRMDEIGLLGWEVIQ